jgi:hypothetical protein
MLVVVGGHSRNIGKTSVAAGIIRATRHARWTAVKITQHGHGICSAAGEPCSCAIEYEHPYALTQELEPTSTDSGRFLAAGAERAYWLRTPVGQLGNAIPELRRILAQAHNTILESNSVLSFLQPDLYLAVLDFANPDMKDSARTFLNRAHALVLIHDDLRPPWNVPTSWLEGKPRFVVTPPGYMSEELVKFVCDRLP